MILPFIYFKSYRSYNFFTALGILSTLFVIGTIIVCCVLLKVNEPKAKKVEILEFNVSL